MSVGGCRGGGGGEREAIREIRQTSVLFQMRSVIALRAVSQSRLPRHNHAWAHVANGNVA